VFRSGDGAGGCRRNGVSDVLRVGESASHRNAEECEVFTGRCVKVVMLCRAFERSLDPAYKNLMDKVERQR
jgi:hypothetical protein